jgi:hypothetical protein
MELARISNPAKTSFSGPALRSAAVMDASLRGLRPGRRPPRFDFVTPIGFTRFSGLKKKAACAASRGLLPFPDRARLQQASHYACLDSPFLASPALPCQLLTGVVISL